MKVGEIMRQDIGSCDLKDNLKTAAEIMQQKNCDTVPVVNEENVIVGMVTEQNICQTIVALDKKASLIKIKDVDFDEAVTCSAEEKIEKALKKMAKNRVNRLIVTSQEGVPVGIISLPNLLSLSGKKKKLQKKIFSVLKAIHKPLPLVLREIEIPFVNV